jgi:hypothetical protein
MTEHVRQDDESTQQHGRASDKMISDMVAHFAQMNRMLGGMTMEVSSIKNNQDRHEKYLKLHVDEEMGDVSLIKSDQAEMRRLLEEIDGKLGSLVAAFPDEDPKSHRDYHDKLIEEAKAKEQAWRDIKMEAYKKGFLYFMAVVGALMILGAQDWLKHFIAHIGGAQKP